MLARAEVDALTDAMSRGPAGPPWSSPRGEVSAGARSLVPAGRQRSGRWHGHRAQAARAPHRRTGLRAAEVEGRRTVRPSAQTGDGHARRPFRLQGAARPQASLFSSRTGRPHAPPFLASERRRARKRAGLEDVRFHDLRHFHLAITQGAATAELTAHAGHSAPRRRSPTSTPRATATWCSPMRWPSSSRRLLSPPCATKISRDRAQIAPVGGKRRAQTCSHLDFRAPGRSRTRNLVGRSHPLCPVELRGRRPPSSDDRPR